MTLHAQKRISQNKRRCDAVGCSGTGPTFITIATGTRGGEDTYEANYACSWDCALVVVTERRRTDAYLELRDL